MTDQEEQEKILPRAFDRRAIPRIEPMHLKTVAETERELAMALRAMKKAK